MFYFNISLHHSLLTELKGKVQELLNPLSWNQLADMNEHTEKRQEDIKIYFNMAKTNSDFKISIFKYVVSRRTLALCVIFSLFLLLTVQRYYLTPYISNGNLSPINPYGSEGVQRLPQAIIVGVMKSGTRATINYLKRHPEVRIARGEVRFFNQNAAYRRGLDFYRQQMPYTKSTTHQVTIEKSPEYFEDTQTPERIKAMDSTIKIVILMREPLKRAVSDFKRTQRAMASWGLNFSFISFEGLATPWLLGGHVWKTFPPVHRSVYIRDLQRWYDTFPADQIHVMDGERLISDPYTEMHMLETFLGVRHFYTPSFFARSEDQSFPCKVNDEGRKQCLGEGKGHVYKPLRDKTKKQLKEYFEPFNQKVYDLVDRDFKWKDID